MLGRHGHSHDQIGPLIALDRETAVGLLSAVLTGNARKPLLLDAFLHDPDWTAWLERAGFRGQRPFTRMVKGPNRTPGQPERQYAMLAPELG